MSEYLKNSEGLFSVVEFHEVVDMDYWNGLVAMARWILQQGPWPATAPNTFSPLDNPMSSKQAHEIVAVDPFVQSLGQGEKYSDEHTREYFRDHGYSKPGLRSWFGVYYSGKFSTTLSWDRPEHQHQTPSESWKLDVLEHLVEHTNLLNQLQEWDIPHHCMYIKNAISVWNDLSQQKITLERYDPVQALGQGDSFAVFLTDCAMYYTGRDQPNVWLGGALMYPSLVAAEKAAKHAKINNYAVVRSVVAVMDVVAQSTTADTSLIQSVVSSQQSTRISGALNNNSSVKTSKTKSKM